MPPPRSTPCRSACLKGAASVRKNDPIAKLEDQTEEGFQTVSNPKFEVYTDKAGEFRFCLKARNGEIIAAPEGYKAKASCMNGIESVRKNAPEAETMDEKELTSEEIKKGRWCGPSPLLHCPLANLRRREYTMMEVKN